MLVPSLTSDFYAEIGRDPVWEQKKFNQVVWRGETTGAYHAKGTGWRKTHRARLVQRELFALSPRWRTGLELIWVPESQSRTKSAARPLSTSRTLRRPTRSG